MSLPADTAATWQAAAHTEGITLPRWIREQVENRPPTPYRRAIISELTGIRTEIRGAMANLNQLAHQANINGVNPADLQQTRDEITRQGELLDTLIRHLR